MPVLLLICIFPQQRPAVVCGEHPLISRLRRQLPPGGKPFYYPCLPPGGEGGAKRRMGGEITYFWSGYLSAEEGSRY